MLTRDNQVSDLNSFAAFLAASQVNSKSPQTGPQPADCQMGRCVRISQTYEHRIMDFLSADSCLSVSLAGNAATWAFGGVPMGSAGLQNQRPNNSSMTSFAATIGGSQPAAPLDPL